MPEDWPLRMIYRYGLIGTVRAYGAWQIAGGSVTLRGIYGQALTWTPAAADCAVPDGWMEPHDGPTAHLPYTPGEEIWPLCCMMSAAWTALKQNIRAMSQPVIVQGTIGSELNAKECSQAVDGFKPTIFTLDRSAVEARTLDLGGTDHTESLIKTINDVDCEILARMGIKSAGTEKASGVTTEETVSITQELNLRLQREYNIYNKFCEAIQDRIPGIRCEPMRGLLETPDGKERDDDAGDDDAGDDTGSAA